MTLHVRPELAGLDALLFDLDDTLFSRRRALARLLEPLATVNEILALLELDAHDPAARDLLCTRLVQLAPREFPSAHAASELLPQRLASCIVGDGRVRELLTRLRNHYRLALVTNGGPAQRDKLTAAGLDGVFEHILISSELGLTKPDARIFGHALDLCAVVPQRALFIGDHLEVDILGARRAGCRSCWVHGGRDRPRRGPQADMEIAQVLELGPLFFPEFPETLGAPC